MNLGFPFRKKEPLSKHNSYKIGGPAKYMAFPESTPHLEKIAEHLKKSGEAFFFLGNGSNVLFSDSGFNGWVIKTTKLPKFIKKTENNTLHAGAALLNARLLRYCTEHGLSGLEFLSGVPGTIGGAAIMNAGTSSNYLAHTVIGVQAFCLERGRQSYPQHLLKYSYRQQHFLKPTEIVIEATFQMKSVKPEIVRQRLAQSALKRRKAQPLEMPCCGSVFRNPEGKSAWKLIEKSGLRGTKIGGARISDKHCNFIINEDNAKLEDVLSLIKLMKEAVFQDSQIELQPEVVVAQPYYLGKEA